MNEREKITHTVSANKGKNLPFQGQESSKPSHTPIDQVVCFQRTIGNHTIQRLYHSEVVQAKLTIGEPNDIYEQEADRVANQIMTVPEPAVQRNAAFLSESSTAAGEDENIRPKSFAITPLVQRREDEEEEEVQAKNVSVQDVSRIQRQAEEERDEEETVQTKGSAGQISKASSRFEESLQAMRGSGRPLDSDIRSYFEPCFERDFSRVRVHTDIKASESATALNSQAFTLGSHIVFKEGKYDPRTASGLQLLTHELTHVADAGFHSRNSNSFLSDPAGPAEQIADKNAAALFNGSSKFFHAGETADAFIHRAPEVWYRGEAEGVGPAAPGSVPHDLGDGLYLSDDVRVANLYSTTRAGEEPAGAKVFSVTFERAMLGKVLDLSTDPRWKSLMETQTPTGRTYGQLIRMANENYGRFFQSFVDQNNLKLENYDAIIGPEFVRGGNQLCVRNKGIAEQIKSMAILQSRGTPEVPVPLTGQRPVKPEIPKVTGQKTEMKPPEIRPPGQEPRSIESIPEVIPKGGIRPGMLPGEGLTGAIAGGAFIIHAALSSFIEMSEREKGENALAERFDWILEQRSRGRWVCVRVVFEGPASVDVLGRAIGFVELPQIHFYHHLEVDTGATKEEVLYPGPSLRQGPPEGRKFYSDLYVYPPLR